MISFYHMMATRIMASTCMHTRWWKARQRLPLALEQTRIMIPSFLRSTESANKIKAVVLQCGMQLLELKPGSFLHPSTSHLYVIVLLKWYCILYNSAVLCVVFHRTDHLKVDYRDQGTDGEVWGSSLFPS